MFPFKTLIISQAEQKETVITELLASETMETILL